MKTFLPVYLSAYNDFSTGGRVFSARCGDHKATIRLTPLEIMTIDMLNKAVGHVQLQEME